MELNTALRQVRKLIERAEHTDTDPAEADACRKKADAMMHKFRIDQAMLEESLPEDQKTQPTMLKDITIAVAGNPARGWLVLLTERIARHCGVQMIYYNYDYTAITLTASAAGYPSALGYFEILFTSVYLHLGSTISPKWNEFQPEEWNIVELHKKGLNWLDIARLNPVQPGGRWHGDQGTAQRVGSRIKRLYKAYCERTRTEYVATGNRIQYIKNFARSYYHTVAQRLDRIESGRDMSGALVLMSDVQRINDMISQMFGEDLGKIGRVGGLDSKYNRDAYEAGVAAGQEVDLSGNARMGGADAKALPR